jgi:hypothetical protein
MKKLVLSFSFSLLLLGMFAQTYWTQSTTTAFQKDAQINALDAAYYYLDLANFKQALFQAPLKMNNYQISNVIIELPLANGSVDKFMVFEAPIMEAGLAAKFPEMKTFIFESMSNRLTYGRADITHKGFHIMLFSEEGTQFIDPFSQLSNQEYIVYFKKNFVTSKSLPNCLSVDEEILEKVDQSLDFHNDAMLNKSAKSSNGGILRIYRIAISATAEFTQFHGGTVVDGLAAVLTTVNRVNSVYEREFTARLVLVANNDLIIYTDASTDPFGNPNNSGQLLGENQNSIDNVIGSANYDVGHVVGRSGSGLASFGVVCRNSKAQGTTGISNPIGDPFDIDYVAHEIGHQFAGSHTFNGSSGSCSGNISSNSAYEPGSGTTIMAYAGICSPQNTQNNSDDYFHGRSFSQVLTYTTVSQGNNCPVKINTGNSIPDLIILSQTGLTIPKSTPFELKASITDLNGDAVTYCWEQYDTGPQGAPNSPTGNAPLFRSFSPTINPTRTFPQISDIVNNTQTMGEILPDYSRGMTFRITARDNVPGGGAVNNDEIDVDVTATSGPFLVLSPNTAITWTAGDPYEVTWDVANTTASPVSCDSVNVLLSTDGGYTFNIILASNIPNMGTTTIIAPFALSTKARVRVEAADNIFFDISDTDFDIESNCNAIDPSITFDEPIPNTTWCVNTLGQLNFSATSPDLLITSYQWFHNGNLINGANASTLSINNVQLSDEGSYYCTMSNGCNTVSTNTSTVFITSNSIVPIITQVGNQLQSSLGFGNQWYLNGVLLPGETDQFITINQGGAYTVSSVAGSCSASSAAFVTAIKDINAIANISIMPNPSQGVFNITIGNWTENVEAEVFNLLGQAVLVKHSFRYNTKLNLSTQTNGLYIVKLSSDGYAGTFKIVKE